MNNNTNYKFYFKDNNIEPLSKISDQDIIDKELTINTNLLNKIEDSIIEAEKIDKKRQQEFAYKLYIKDYITESCSNQVCKEDFSVEKCVNCILKHNKILCEKLDDTAIYCDCHNKNSLILITANDLLSKLPKRFNPNKNILSQYNLPNHLINNIKADIWRLGPKSITFLNHTLQLDTYRAEEQIGIISFLLFPEQGSFNPIAFKILKAITTTATSIPLSDPTILEIERIQTGSFSENSRSSLSEETLAFMHEGLKHLFNKSIKSFLESTYLWDNPAEIIKIENSLKEVIPTSVQKNPSLQDPKIIQEIAQLLLFSQDTYIFNFFPPTENTLEAIFYYQQKFLFESYSPNFSPKLSSYHIEIYDILYLAAQRILQKTTMPKETLAQDKDYSKIRSHIYSMVSIEDSSLPPKELNDKYVTSISNNDTLNKSPFLNLRKTLFNISNGNTNSIDELILLIGRIFLGQKALKSFQSNEPLITIIQCSNPKYIQTFFSQIIPSKYITTHSLKSLQPKLIPQLIEDKVNCTLLNIDSSESTCSDLSFLKKFISGNKIPIDNPPFFKIFHINTTPYLYITNKNDNQLQKTFSGIDYKKITFTGNISQCRYQELDPYETIFMSIASIYYAIDIYSNNEDSSLKTDTIFQEVLPESTLIENFLLCFCIDQTEKIDNEKILSINPKDLTDKKKHTAIIKNLGIDQLEYSTRADLHHAFALWYEATYHNKSSISVDDFTDKLNKKYPNIFYKKRSYTEIYSKKKHEARGFYGLHIKVEDLDSYIEHQLENAKYHSDEELKNTFTQYLEMLLKKYEPILFGMHN